MLEVNSYHHQGINHLGTGLKITGVSDDGIVEAIELESRPNVMGVQWHPERMLYNPLHKILFTWFKSEQT
jgi:putative glutamine amidotransferase